MNNVAIIGGGAAGFFTAISLAERSRESKITLFETSSKTLTKVKVSGGGRCNVTHKEFQIGEFVKNYPRGMKEMVGPFHQFQAKDMIDWLLKNGVSTRAEEDGRIFPDTNSSETIINLFEKKVKELKIEVITNTEISGIQKVDEKFYLDSPKSLSNSKFDFVVIASGSSKKMWDLLKGLGHTISNLYPSLFSFNIKHPLLEGLMGISFLKVRASLSFEGKKYSQIGPCLITHWGLSGPAIIKLSSFAAKDLAKCNYVTDVSINWINEEAADCENKIKSHKEQELKKLVKNSQPFELTMRFWERIIETLSLQEKKWADLSNKDILVLKQALTEYQLPIRGQTKFKDEFVTCGGINLKEIDFKKMESKIIKNLYFAGEVIDVDGITGGFNFQNAWTTAFIAASHIATQINN